MLPTNRLSAPLSRLRRRLPNQTRVSRALYMQMRPTLNATVPPLTISGRINVYPTGFADNPAQPDVLSIPAQQNWMVISREGNPDVILSYESTNLKRKLKDFERLYPDQNEF